MGGIFGWVSGLGLGGKIALGAAALALIAAGAWVVEGWLTHGTDVAVEQAEGKGRAEAVAAGQETTLGQIGAANEAGNKVRGGAGADRFCECVRSAAPGTAGNCVRYWPHELVPGGPDDPDVYCAGERD